jgi:hypothetical protein
VSDRDGNPLAGCFVAAVLSFALVTFVVGLVVLVAANT